MKKYYMRQIFADTKSQAETTQAVSSETYDKGSYCDFCGSRTENPQDQQIS